MNKATFATTVGDMFKTDEDGKVLLNTIGYETIPNGELGPEVAAMNMHMASKNRLQEITMQVYQENPTEENRNRVLDIIKGQMITPERQHSKAIEFYHQIGRGCDWDDSKSQCSINDKKSQDDPHLERMRKESVNNNTAEEALILEEEGFISSKKFQGAKKGYVFKKSTNGLGYYKDVLPVVGDDVIAYKIKLMMMYDDDHAEIVEWLLQKARSGNSEYDKQIEELEEQNAPTSAFNDLIRDAISKAPRGEMSRDKYLRYKHRFTHKYFGGTGAGLQGKSTGNGKLKDLFVWPRQSH